MGSHNLMQFFFFCKG